MSLDNLTPKMIVNELDKYIVGQASAKKLVAIALRNRIRRMKLSEDIRQVTQKWLMMDLQESERLKSQGDWQ